MTARRTITLPLAAALLALAMSAQQLPAQTAHDLFQRALRLERVDGDLAGANALFRQVADGIDRGLAAQALLRIGENAERMGRAEAVDAYERLVREFADQAAAADAARTRLAVLRPTSPTAPVTAAVPPARPDLTVRLVWAGSELDGLDVEGRPTPDGRYLTFVDWSSGDLAVRDLAAGTSRRITNRGYPEYALFSSVSPDGRQVAYVWALPPWQPQLRIIGMDGTAERVLLDNANGEIDYLQPLEWTPDGRHIAVLVYMADRTSRLTMVDAVSGELRIVKSLDWRQPMLASLSPDGRYIVYDLPLGEPEQLARSIFLIAADGSFEIPLVEGRSNDLHPIWAPDGEHVLFSSDRGGSIDLWAIRVVDGRPRGEPVLVKRDMAHNFFYPMGFTRDGAFFYTKDTGGGDIYLAPFDPEAGRVTGAARRLVNHDVGYNTAPHFSPNGSRLVYATRSGALSLGHTAFLVIEDVATGERTDPLRDVMVGRKNVRLRWSPDGRGILVNGSTQAQQRGLYLVDAGTGEVTPLVVGEPGVATDVGQAEWLPDGGAIVYTRTVREGTSSGTVLIRRELAEEEPGQHREQELLRIGWPAAWTLAPDGRSVAYLRRVAGGSDSAAVWLAPMDGGEPRELVRFADPFDSASNVGLAFTADGRHVLYSTGSAFGRDRTAFQLWRVGVVDGQAEPLDLAMDHLRAMSVTPDGRGLLFAAGDLVYHEVWVMDNVLRQVQRR
jgi:Tol biopolymer transport system component